MRVAIAALNILIYSLVFVLTGEVVVLAHQKTKLHQQIDRYAEECGDRTDAPNNR